MANLLAQLQSDLNSARKAQDKPATLLLGTLLSELKNRNIELGRELADDDVIEVLRKSIKKRRESVEAFEKHGRTDLAATEAAEIAIIEKYLPADLGDDEIRTAVRQAIAGGAANVGKVMSAVMPQLKGRADGTRINAVVREELSRQS